MANAKYLLSSQTDNYIVKPFARQLPRSASWQFIFLQHGVAHNDLSNWLNAKPIDLMVTTTTAEYNAIVSDGSTYRLGKKEVVLTGLPRHDALLRKFATRRLQQETILVTATWRNHLMCPQTVGHRRELLPNFTDSQYYRAWRELLISAELLQVAEAHGLAITFVPHPNLQHVAGVFRLPDHVRQVAAEDLDIQAEVARARLMVTDYSSLAFEAAYLGKPVVYYQFDRDQFFSGRHILRPGYFSYDRDGFGPVAETFGDTIDSIAALAPPRSALRVSLEERLEGAFPFRISTAATASTARSWRVPSHGRALRNGVRGDDVDWRRVETRSARQSVQ